MNFSGNASCGRICSSSQNLSMDNGEIQVTVKSIDSMPECERATFTKKDIEGAEYDALLDAEKLIRANKPKLAICIYHSDEDMLRLAELIHDMVLEYHFYVRRHSNSRTETVLYCQI